MSLSTCRRLVMLLPVLLAAVASPCRANSETPTHAPLVERLQKAHMSLKTLRAHITETRRFVHFDEEESREGTLFVKRGEGVRLEFHEPMAELLVVAHGKALVFNPRIKQLQSFRLPEESQQTAPLWPLVPGGAPAPENIRPLEPMDGMEGFVVTSAPGDSSQPYVEKRVWLDPEDGLPRRIELKEPADDLVIYVLREVERDPALSDELFRFVPPEGTEVIEHDRELSF